MTRTTANRLAVALTLAALLWASGAAAQTPSTEKLGKVHFPVACSAAAQPQFDRAVALLHSFWYSEGVKAFTAVAATDRACAMAHWGIAMSLWYPLWQAPDAATLKKGWVAVEQAKTLGASTERERDYIAAIEAFYRDSDKLDHRTRGLAYEKAMERLYVRYPQDREAAVFYALALNATALPTDKTYANQQKAGEILKKVFAEQPDHPGVAHYIIHSYDYSLLGNRALTAARRYSQVAPSSPHAQHMPSHIFIRLGLWQETIRSDRAAAVAARDANSVFEQLHSLDYLMYAYLQGAQDREAKRVVDDRNAIGRMEQELIAAAYGFAAIPARFAIETRRWAEAALLEPRPSRFTFTEAITHFARALGAARGGDATSARKDVERLETLRDGLTQAKQTYWAEQVEIQRRAAAAWVARADGKTTEALALMRSAADLEDSTEKHPVTPGPIVPARELLGELLLDLQQPAQALMEFEAALRSSPNRFNGLYGVARSAELSGDRDKAKGHYAKLVAVCEKADTERRSEEHTSELQSLRHLVCRL